MLQRYDAPSIQNNDIIKHLIYLCKLNFEKGCISLFVSYRPVTDRCVQAAETELGLASQNTRLKRRFVQTQLCCVSDHGWEKKKQLGIQYKATHFLNVSPLGGR